MNRGESEQLAGGASPAESTPDELRHEEPELLNSYNTPEAEDEGTFMAELDDPSDFV
jgi:hypothetical protein